MRHNVFILSAATNELLELRLILISILIYTLAILHFRPSNVT
jgi:hypothetical protein